MNTDARILTMLLDSGANNISDIDIINNSKILQNKESCDAIELFKNIRILRNAPKDLLWQIREELADVYGN